VSDFLVLLSLVVVKSISRQVSISSILVKRIYVPLLIQYKGARQELRNGTKLVAQSVVWIAKEYPLVGRISLWDIYLSLEGIFICIGCSKIAMQPAAIKGIYYQGELRVELDLPIRRCTQSIETFVCYLYHWGISLGRSHKVME